jgi:hypothetical protein
VGAESDLSGRGSVDVLAGGPALKCFRFSVRGLAF